MLKVPNAEIEHLRICYAKDLRKETQASKTVRDSMRKIISIFNEVLRFRMKYGKDK